MYLPPLPTIREESSRDLALYHLQNKGDNNRSSSFKDGAFFKTDSAFPRRWNAEIQESLDIFSQTNGVVSHGEGAISRRVQEYEKERKNFVESYKRIFEKFEDCKTEAEKKALIQEIGLEKSIHTLKKRLNQLIKEFKEKKQSKRKEIKPILKIWKEEQKFLLEKLQEVSDFKEYVPSFIDASEKNGKNQNVHSNNDLKSSGNHTIPNKPVAAENPVRFFLESESDEEEENLFSPFFNFPSLNKHLARQDIYNKWVDSYNKNIGGNHLDREELIEFRNLSKQLYDYLQGRLKSEFELKNNELAQRRAEKERLEKELPKLLQKIVISEGIAWLRLTTQWPKIKVSRPIASVHSELQTKLPNPYHRHQLKIDPNRHKVAPAGPPPGWESPKESRESD